MAYFIGLAWAGELPQQVAAPEHIAWYWLVLAAIGLGTLIGNSFTEGYKRFRYDHPSLPRLKPADVRIIGRILSGLFTYAVWWGISILTEQPCDIKLGVILSVVSAGLAPFMWDAYDKGTPILWAWIRKKLGINGDAS